MSSQWWHIYQPMTLVKNNNGAKISHSSLTHSLPNFSSVSLILTKGKLQNLPENSWFAWVFWLVLVGFVFFEGKSPLKKWLNFDDCLSKKQLGMNCSRLVTRHSYEAFTYLFGRYIFIFLHSANKNCFEDLWTIKNHGLSGIRRESQQR